MKRMNENTIAQFFSDSGFMPPEGGRDFFNASFGFETGVDRNMDFDGYDGIPDTILDVTKDLNDGEESPAPGIYGDFYMFNDPGVRTSSTKSAPPSSSANQLNQQYRKKDLSRIESASDVHLETLEQPVGEFPRHNQIRSQMEPSVLADDSYPQPGELLLHKPTMIEGKVYPTGTRIFTENNLDDLYENPKAKLCPLCAEPYIDTVCPYCKNRQPSSSAIRVKE